MPVSWSGAAWKVRRKWWRNGSKDCCGSWEVRPSGKGITRAGEYRADSPLRDLFVQVYREQYGKDPKVEAIHAGVECGMFAAKLPGLDCISLGPTLTEIHTYRETMHIASVQRTWNLLLEVLKRMK